MGRWHFPRLIAHRCGGVLAPENTLAGLRQASLAGYGAVEFDVMLARDRTPVLIHDETLDRTTNGCGRVADHDYAQLACLDASAGFGAGFGPEPIPDLASAARLCRQLNLWANVELKPAEGSDQETGALVAWMVRRYWEGADQWPLLSSFSEVALAAARKAAPLLPRGLLVGVIPPDWQARMARLGCVTLHCDAAVNPPERLAQVVASGTPVLCYTVNLRDMAWRLLEQGVSAVFTDRLDRLRPENLPETPSRKGLEP